METKTVEELRALAKARGLTGYSKLTRAELLKLLAKENTAPAIPHKARPAKTKSPAAKSTPRKAARPAARAAAGFPAAPPASTPDRLASGATPTSSAERIDGEEERIEQAKFAMAPPGAGFAEPRFVPDLGEDIERLPTIGEPMLGLLPQKPGILHGYWRLAPDTRAQPRPLKLRLGRITGEVFEVLEEIPVAQAHGHWYFHVEEAADYGALYLQLGYYESAGRFVSAIRRGIARIPSLYASERTDRLWWVSEEQFRAMYLRAGGFARGARLGWAASTGSPVGAPPAAHERLAWPGGVSSQR
ncbi:MAG: hypothetical protein A2151_01945 [Candidatus Muproteobacteria bacterium RBG_16_65_34]|uniref:Rho termination factor-like N-terminal domain-containing protein n=1 Tax=Candidatus Muproteobacteria bacterium RBG_16_65_34 TaxID=1817760 RepID=A0A1F6TLI6_9PROT|nr:MAG: hypothetical protein A2151_01945 [Candidatus Muproteobacteria bacterium RBG_16_65_34]